MRSVRAFLSLAFALTGTSLYAQQPPVPTEVAGIAKALVSRCANDQVLVKDSTAASGVKCATVAGGGTTISATGSQILYRAGATEAGGVSGSSWDGTTLTLPSLVQGKTVGDPTAVPFITMTDAADAAFGVLTFGPSNANHVYSDTYLSNLEVGVSGNFGAFENVRLFGKALTALGNNQAWFGAGSGVDVFLVGATNIFIGDPSGSASAGSLAITTGGAVTLTSDDEMRLVSSGYDITVDPGSGGTLKLQQNTVVLSGKTIQGTYKSNDGTAGFTGTCTIAGLTSIVIKNGLVVSCS